MGLKFYVHEAQTRSSQASQLNSQAGQAIASLQQSIHSFLSAPLSSKAYDSAKSYFLTVYTPLCQSAIMTGEAMEAAHKRFLSEYQGSVSGIDTDEDLILEEINQLERLKQSLDQQMSTAKTPRPDLERRYMNACDVIEKRREKLEKFHAYNALSASIFSECEACQQEFDNGLAQMKDCKAWNPATGTFDISRLNMTWAKTINDRWKAREIKRKKQKEEAFNNNLKQLKGYTIYAMPYEDPITKEVTISWFIDKDGKRLDNSELQRFLEEHGAELDPSYYRIVDWRTIQDLENAALRRGETYITGQKYTGMSKGMMQLNGYISSGYVFAQKSGLYDLAMMAGLSQVNKVHTAPKKINSNDSLNLYRKNQNMGAFKGLGEVMDLKNVKKVAKESGIGLQGVKIRIERDPDLIGRGICGYASPDGKTITLYPDAFTNKESLIKTIGHERTHVYQVKTFGTANDAETLRLFENGAWGSEKDWWNYYKSVNGGK